MWTGVNWISCIILEDPVICTDSIEGGGGGSGV